MLFLLYERAKQLKSRPPRRSCMTSTDQSDNRLLQPTALKPAERQH